MTESTPNQAILKGSKTLAQVRMAFIMLTLVVLVLLSLLLRLVFFLFPRHLFLRFNVRFIIYPFSRLLMWIVGVKLLVKGKMPSSQHLIVSNHQGILDSLLHMAISPCMVISNMLIRNMKVIGSVMELLGFVFVDRSRRMSIVELLQPATSMITQSKVNMSFFPEGKSNNGVELLPFQNRTGSGVQPIFKIAKIDSGSGVQADSIQMDTRQWPRIEQRSSGCREDTFICFNKIPRKAWVHRSAPVQSIGFAKKEKRLENWSF